MSDAELNTVTQDAAEQGGVFVSNDGDLGAISVPAEPVVEKLAGPSVDPTLRKQVRSWVMDVLNSVFGDDKPEPPDTSFKVLGNHWFATWSNNFIDREGEIFPAKAIDDYVARVDAGLVPLPELWVWHLGKDTRIGQAEMVARHGHFSIAAGTFDATEQGQRARKYYARHQKDTSFSHGFTYNPRTFDGKHYGEFNTFELTTLPRGPEANRYTTLDGVKDHEMTVTKDKEKYLTDVFGEDGAKKILADLDQAGKALEDIGVEFKDFGHVEPEAPAVNAAADKAVKDLVAELITDQGEALDATLTLGKAFKDYKSTTDAQIKDMMATLRTLQDAINQRPRSASKDSATELTTARIEAIEQAAKEQSTAKDPFWGTTVTQEGG